ncbi:MAG: anaerobic ribonucleoside-triphosphate reductase activating protein [Clostridium sp.]
MNYAEIKQYDVANTPNISCTLFVSGCTNNCKGCFNKELQDFSYGKLWTKETENYFIKCCKNPHVKNVAILGGEPMQQQITPMLNLLKRIKAEVNKPIWVWTGCLWEDLIRIYHRTLFFPYIDILIDGKFEIDKKDLILKHRGSSNQRIIDVQKSLEENKVILAEEYYK